MKKILAFALALMLLSALALPAVAENIEGTEAPQPSTEATQPSTEATQPSTEATQPSTEATQPSTEATQPSTEATAPSESTEATEPDNVLKITKHPTSEHVQVGGYCEFVARADNSTATIWHIVSPDGSKNVHAEDGGTIFRNLWVTGQGTERLGINYIPKAMHGWRIRAEFVGEGGVTYSNDAIIYVEEPPLTSPTITTQPQSVTGTPGTPAVLQIRASAPEAGARVLYQWYRSTTPNGGTEIPGATASTYTPEEIPGIRYYSCTVRSTDGTQTSAPVRSQSVSVTFPEPTQPTETTQPTTAATEPVTEPVVTEPEVETTFEPLPEETPGPEISSRTILLAVSITVAVIALIGVAALIVSIRKDRM